MKGIKWVLAEVPLADIDWSSDKRWAAHHQQAKVDHFAAQLQAGETVDPAVGIIQPGESHVRVIDGHHRSLACRQIGWPSRMYVGSVDDAATAHAALETHLYQVHQGDDPANKAASEPRVAGLLVRAGDTGRVLMLQRALDDDPGNAGGKWEPPGGHAEQGESLARAAMREFSEEVGHPVPTGSLTGSWTSGDGIYRGFVMEVPSEDVIDLEHGRDQVHNPDGDSFECAAWFDPAQFEGNESMRPEMIRDLPQVMAALRGEVAKSAETPMLEITPRILGPEGLWHTPDRHVGGKQKLPDYIEQVAGALMDQQGMGESEAIATAINAIKRWATGDLHWGRRQVTPEVIAASQDALRQWDDLKASHH